MESRGRTLWISLRPEIYLTESGLAAHLAGITRLDPGHDDLLRSALYETNVAQNVLALLG